MVGEKEGMKYVILCQFYAYTFWYGSDCWKFYIMEREGRRKRERKKGKEKEGERGKGKKRVRPSEKLRVGERERTRERKTEQFW